MDDVCDLIVDLYNYNKSKVYPPADLPKLVVDRHRERHNRFEKFGRRC